MVGRNGVQTDVCPIYRAVQYARLEGISSIRLVGIRIVGIHVIGIALWE